jgi:hypothetical protein
MAMSQQELELLGRPVLRILSIDVGIRNLALWLGTIRTDDLCQQTEVWRVVDVVSRHGLEWDSVNDHSIPECCDLVDAYFACATCDVPADAQIDVVLIEQQPTNTGIPGAKQQRGVSQIRMFGVSLTMRQTLRRMFPAAYMADFVSAKLKLQLLDEQAKAEAKAEPDRARRRKIHKTRTIGIVQTLEHVPQDQGRKLDDLADCWLQARAWVHVHAGLRAKHVARQLKAAASLEKKAAAELKRAQKAAKKQDTKKQDAKTQDAKKQGAKKQGAEKQGAKKQTAAKKQKVAKQDAGAAQSVAAAQEATATPAAAVQALELAAGADAVAHRPPVTAPTEETKSAHITVPKKRKAGGIALGDIRQ